MFSTFAAVVGILPSSILPSFAVFASSVADTSTATSSAAIVAFSFIATAASQPVAASVVNAVGQHISSVTTVEPSCNLVAAWVVGIVVLAFYRPSVAAVFASSSVVT